MRVNKVSYNEMKTITVVNHVPTGHDKFEAEKLTMGLENRVRSLGYTSLGEWCRYVFGPEETIVTYNKIPNRIWTFEKDGGQIWVLCEEPGPNSIVSHWDNSWECNQNSKTKTILPLLKTIVEALEKNKRYDLIDIPF